MLAGANKLVLEVTCGSGAFMKKLEEAKLLSQVMKNLGNLAKIETVCLITNMDQPIGKAIRKFSWSRRSKRELKWKNGRWGKRDCFRNKL